MGPCTASHCCCLHRHTLPCANFQVSSHCWCVPFFCHRVLADYGPPIAAARPLICHGPLYRLLMLLPGPEFSWVPVRPPIAAVTIATLCHVPLSGLLTLLVCSIFC
ncbi:unnamed protein product, partial [Staurois parvus]